MKQATIINNKGGLQLVTYQGHILAPDTLLLREAGTERVLRCINYASKPERHEAAVSLRLYFESGEDDGYLLRDGLQWRISAHAAPVECYQARVGAWSFLIRQRRGCHDWQLDCAIGNVIVCAKVGATPELLMEMWSQAAQDGLRWLQEYLPGTVLLFGTTGTGGAHGTHN